MKAKFVRLRSSVMLLIFSMGLVVGGQTGAQAATIDHEKATLVSKLARYVSWPAEARQRNLLSVFMEMLKNMSILMVFLLTKVLKVKILRYV